MMPLAESLNPLTSFLEHVARHGDYQPHVGRIIEALGNQAEIRALVKSLRFFLRADSG